MTFDKLNINLGKTYAKLRIFPKIFENRAPHLHLQVDTSADHTLTL